MIKHETLTFNDKEVKEMLDLQSLFFSSEPADLEYMKKNPKRRNVHFTAWTKDEPQKKLSEKEVGDLLFLALKGQDFFKGYKRSGLEIRSYHYWIPSGDPDYPYKSGYKADFIFRKTIDVNVSV